MKSKYVTTHQYSYTYSYFVSTFVGTGWSQNLKQREPSLPQHICSVNSSKLKFEWTMDSIQGILTMIEVTQQNNGMVPATLVLTSDAIFLMSEEEDCQLGMEWFHIKCH